VKGTVTAKLRAHVVVCALALGLGIVLGRPELIAVSAPLIVTTVWGLAATRRPQITARLLSGQDSVVEGDEFAVNVSLQGSSPGAGIVAVALGLSADLEDSGDGRGTVDLGADPGEAREVDFTLRTRRWGLQRIGPVVVRTWGPGRLVSFEELHNEHAVVRVLPLTERIRKGVVAGQAKIFSGDYVSRASGEGIEFAGVRAFGPGDTVRRINWRVTSRRGDLHVNLGHPERDTDLVLFLDTFADIELRSHRLLDLTVRGAAALAQHHLRHNDRVGLVSFGGTMRWLNASMGRTQSYRIADFLLGINATFSYAWKDIDRLPAGTLPPGASVVAFSPLIDERALRALTDLAGRGFQVAVVNTLAEEQVDPLPTPEGRLAHRVWKLEREARRALLSDAGIPSVTWTGEAGLEATLRALPRRRSGVRSR
jgi:uncharacterized protein (DUF58 family)